MAKTFVKGLSTSQGIVRTPYPAGMYKFLVKEAEVGESKNGNTMFTFKHEIAEFPDVEDGRDLKGKLYTARFVIMEEHEFMVDRLKDYLNAGGLKVGSDDGVDEKKMVGKEVYGKMIQKAGSDGTTQAEVTKWYSVDEVEKQTDSDE
jgi:hypothetical protein